MLVQRPTAYDYRLTALRTASLQRPTAPTEDPVDRVSRGPAGVTSSGSPSFVASSKSAAETPAPAVDLTELESQARTSPDPFIRRRASVALADRMGALESKKLLMGPLEGSLAYLRASFSSGTVAQFGTLPQLKTGLKSLAEAVGQDPVPVRVADTVFYLSQELESAKLRDPSGDGEGSAQEVLVGQIETWWRQGQLRLTEGGEDLKPGPEVEVTEKLGNRHAVGHDGEAIRLDSKYGNTGRDLDKALRYRREDVDLNQLAADLVEDMAVLPHAAHEVGALFMLDDMDGPPSEKDIARRHQAIELFRPHSAKLLNYVADNHARGLYNRGDDETFLLSLAGEAYGEHLDLQIKNLGLMVENGEAGEQTTAFQRLVHRAGMDAGFRALEKRADWGSVDDNLLRGLNRSFDDGKWTPTASQVNFIASCLNVPHDQFVLGGMDFNFRSAVALLTSIQKKQPGLMSDWQVYNSQGELVDYRDAILERVVDDRGHSDVGALQDLIPYQPYPEASFYFATALPQMLFDGPGGEARADRALAQLESKLDGVEAKNLDQGGQRLVALLTNAKLPEKQQQRLRGALAGIPAKSGSENLDHLMAAHRRAELWRELKTTPVNELPPEPPAEAGLAKSDYARYLGNRYLAEVSQDPASEHEELIRAIRLGEDQLPVVLEVLKEAAGENRLTEVFGTLKQAVKQLGPALGMRLADDAARAEEPITIALPAALNIFGLAQKSLEDVELRGWDKEKMVFGTYLHIQSMSRMGHGSPEAVAARFKKLAECERMGIGDEDLTRLVTLHTFMGLKGPSKEEAESLSSEQMDQRVELFSQVNKEFRYLTRSTPVFYAVERQVDAGDDPERAVSRLSHYRQLNRDFAEANYSKIVDRALASGEVAEVMDTGAAIIEKVVAAKGEHGYQVKQQACEAALNAWLNGTSAKDAVEAGLDVFAAAA